MTRRTFGVRSLCQRQRDPTVVIHACQRVFASSSSSQSAYGYSAVFSAGNPFFGSFTEFAFLKGFTPESVGNTPIKGLP
ncbi:hypothetical protein EN784_54625, partial [bacterium M00.F.Ca.ET.141.01.1.1]